MASTTSARSEVGIQLGKPTDYGFSLPRIRYDLTKPFIRGSKLLDFGCGNGANTVLFDKDFNEIVGLEVEQERLSEANEYLRDTRIKNIIYKAYDGSVIPYKDSCFDTVVSYEVIEHTLDDVASLKEVYRVLKGDGVFALSVPNKWYLMETHGLDLPFSGVIPWNRVPLLSWLPRRIHEKYARARIYSKKAITDKLNLAGFVLIEHSYIMPPFDKVNNTIIRTVLSSITKIIDKTPLKVIGVAHFIVVKKSADLDRIL